MMTLLFSHLRQVVKVIPICIVGHAILPNEVDVISSIVYGFVFPLIHFLLYKTKIHGLFDDLGVVKESEGLPIDRFSERFWYEQWRGG